MNDMDLSKLNQKTLQVSRGFTYTYYTSPAQPSKPTLALIHGWPDTAKLWAGLINSHLLPAGYGVLALDCLGYGGTSKPTNNESYSYQQMATDITEILDAEGIPEVVALGHDWGSGLAQRLYHFYPARVSGLVMVNVPYMPATADFDLETVNNVTRDAYGMGIFEYWHFFKAEDAAGILNENLEAVYSIAFGDPEAWPGVLCTPDGMRKWVSEGRTHPTLPYATAEHKADFMGRLGEEPGFDAPLRWYKAMVVGVQNEAERSVPAEGNVVEMPTLFWGGEQDYVCRAAGLEPHVDAGLLPKLKTVTREGGHWALLERPAEFGQDVVAWLQEAF
ncbi:putative epoxide hydrolase [Colletotrichum karsti]|uniref:Epoxide hydrolase n=1 Tax=Colletotrichum karsti TaxID=1095194 RepID=A0A9P6HYV3_9PEZI|nr:putative epoxide hydrolase [Colletotrichum karsti]KAF9872949.1 putative epoxide hydrolase [Colletotrichum karsti]